MSSDGGYKTPGVYVDQVPSPPAPISGASTSVAAFVGVTKTGPDPGTVHAISNYRKFLELFAVGDKLPSDIGFVYLAHGVYGFFNNGGAQCYVTTAAYPSSGSKSKKSKNTNSAGLKSVDISKALMAFAPYEDISIVAAPGLTGEGQWSALLNYCNGSATIPNNCFAILDSPEDSDWTNGDPIVLKDNDGNPQQLPAYANNAAIYYPWIKVANVIDGGEIAAPPSGHIAGIYARVDAERGVFKAPANEAVYGALDLVTRVSRKQQESLNAGYDDNDAINVNCIRYINGSILVWGARTLQPDDDGQFKYISTRRTFDYIRQSLEDGTQWVVFEPNTEALWGQIVRNVTAFLTKLWQSGGLFGATAAEAFFVECDAATNPESSRNEGKVVTKVGVAITKPAEFVVFELGLTSGNATPSTST